MARKRDMAAELTSARTKLGLSQQALADALEVHRVSIARWESGAVPVPRMVLLAISALKPKRS